MEFEHVPIFSVNELNKLEGVIDYITSTGPEFDNFNTRTAKRKYMSIDLNKHGSFNSSGFYNVYEKSEYGYMSYIIIRLVEFACTTIKQPNDKIVLLQLFINYYKDGSNSSPMHKHGCRQVTLAFGCPRPLVVKFEGEVDAEGVKKRGHTKKFILESGHAIFLNGQQHGVPKTEESDVFYSEPRISFNLFFTTRNEGRYNVNG